MPANPFAPLLVEAVEGNVRDRHGFFPSEVAWAAANHTAFPTNAGGWFPTGIHSATGTAFNPAGFDWDGHRPNGRLADEQGFAAGGEHRTTGTLYSQDGFDRNGFDISNRDASGMHAHTGTPLDSRGFDREGIHKETGKRVDAEGWTVDRLRKNGSRAVGGRNYYGIRSGW